MAVACTRAHRLAFVALLAAALLAIMGTADAHAQQYYKVVNRYSGMCLDVATPARPTSPGSSTAVALARGDTTSSGAWWARTPATTGTERGTAASASTSPT